MAIEYLKRSKPEAQKAEDDARVRAVVAATLKDIEARSDAAVHELAVKFDNYDRESYRLSEAEISSIISKLGPRDMEDIKFAQAQEVGNFAQGPAGQHAGHRGRDPAGRGAGPQEHPSAISGLLRAGRQIPDGRICTHVGSDSLSSWCTTDNRLHTAVQR
jgi:hypothetical protein